MSVKKKKKHLFINMAATNTKRIYKAIWIGCLVLITTTTATGSSLVSATVDTHATVSSYHSDAKATESFFVANQTETWSQHNGSMFGVSQTLPEDPMDLDAVVQLLQETERYVKDMIDEASCRNKHSLCSFWAVKGECQTNPNFMHSDCAPACQTCKKVEIKGDKNKREKVDTHAIDENIEIPLHNVPQTIDTTIETKEVLLAKLTEITEYVKNLGRPQSSCVNAESMCILWSLRGECQNNELFMAKRCAAACQTCHTVESSTFDEKTKEATLQIPRNDDMSQTQQPHKEREAGDFNDTPLREETNSFATATAQELWSMYQSGDSDVTAFLQSHVKQSGGIVPKDMPQTSGQLFALYVKIQQARQMEQGQQQQQQQQQQQSSHSNEHPPKGVRHDLYEQNINNLKVNSAQEISSTSVDLMNPGQAFGEVQLLESPEEPIVSQHAVLTKIQETSNYVNEFRKKNAKRYSKEVLSLCHNQDEMCTMWSLQGECEKDAAYMIFNCAPSCQTCDQIEYASMLEEDEEEDEVEVAVGPGSRFGVVQTIDPAQSSKLFQKLEESEHYFENVVMTNETFALVRSICRNDNPMCTHWALEGECEKNPAFMTTKCPVACETCHLLHYDIRCAKDPNDIDAFLPGDLNKMFESIVNHHQNVTVLSRPSLLPDDDEDTVAYELGPWIISIDDFISPEEASQLVYFGKKLGYERSIGVGEVDEVTGEAEEDISDSRTSSNAWCEDECEEDTLVAGVLNRIEVLTGVPNVNSEALQLLHYKVGQYYNVHHDYIEYEQNSIQGPRVITVFMYLNDVEEGGETRFDEYDLYVKPKLGRVILWPSVLDEDPSSMDDRTEHEAMPVIRGEKFGANAWLHLRSRKKGIELDC